MARTTCPAILVAAPASGQGKTTVTSALARLHTRQGRRVRVFKCGPDFLDPYWHSLASGAPVYQLDLWMTGEEDCRARLHAAAQEADLIIVEGVMGLFDGDPSAADLAQRFGLPVLAVVDASAMAGTFGALAFGLQHYRADMPWAGVLANRVASVRHAEMLQTSLKDPAAWQGALMRNAGIVLPERHLGLTVASEVPDALARLDAAADALADTPLGRMALVDLQRWAVHFEEAGFTATSAPGEQVAAGSAPCHPPALRAPSLPAQNPLPPALPSLVGKTVAIARDAAFCFIYTANLDCLRDLGAELIFFSPLGDACLPACDAVWLPGGYPELHGTQLAANTTLWAALRAHVEQGQALLAECGGMMSLFASLVDLEGQTFKLGGLLPGVVRMQKRLAGLGMQEVTLPEGTLRGHTFHYSSTETTLAPLCASQRPDGRPGEAIYRQQGLTASYMHFYFPSNPHASAQLLGA